MKNLKPIVLSDLILAVPAIATAQFGLGDTIGTSDADIRYAGHAVRSVGASGRAFDQGFVDRGDRHHAQHKGRHGQSPERRSLPQSRYLRPPAIAEPVYRRPDDRQRGETRRLSRLFPEVVLAHKVPWTA